MNDKEMKREKKTREIIFLNSDKYNEWQGGEEGKETREIILLAFHKSSSCRPSQFAATKGFSPYL